MDVVKQKISEADIIYVGGGDTFRLMNMVKDTKMDKMFLDARKRNCVMCGVSAGAIIWSASGLSDYQIINNMSDSYAKIDGLGFSNYMFVPHFSSDKKKETDLKRVIKNTNIKCLCVDNCAAVKIIDDRLSVIKSNKESKVYLASYEDEYKKEEIV